jgi:hypothetical protein
MAFYSLDPVRFGVGVSGATTARGVNDPELGTRCVVDELEYIFVYNAGGENIGVGQPVTLSGVTGYSVTVSCITNVDVGLGVRQHSTLSTASYGWVATRGIGTIEMGADESCAVGEPIVVGAEGFAGYVEVLTTTTGFATPTVGKAMEAIASGASGIAFFSML